MQMNIVKILFIVVSVITSAQRYNIGDDSVNPLMKAGKERQSSSIYQSLFTVLVRRPLHFSCSLVGRHFEAL